MMTPSVEANHRRLTSFAAMMLLRYSRSVR
jgi:hypothetical protein